jgi:RNA polymerase sigma-B factor
MRFSHRGEALDDLCQVALLALLRALRNFDPNRGAQFSTYAIPTIVGALKRHLRDRGWLVRPPRRTQHAYLEVTAASEQLGAELHRTPTGAEIAEYMSVPVDHVKNALEARGGRYPVPFDVALDARGAHAGEALVSDKGAQVARAEDQLFMGQLVGRLPEGEREVLALTFCGLTQGEIAARLGTSQSTVSRLRRRGIGRLRLLCSDASAA